MHIEIILDLEKELAESNSLISASEERQYSGNIRNQVESRRAALISAIADATAIIKAKKEALAEIA